MVVLGREQPRDERWHARRGRGDEVAPCESVPSIAPSHAHSVQTWYVHERHRDDASETSEAYCVAFDVPKHSSCVAVLGHSAAIERTTAAYGSSGESRLPAGTTDDLGDLVNAEQKPSHARLPPSAGSQLRACHAPSGSVSTLAKSASDVTFGRPKSALSGRRCASLASSSSTRATVSTIVVTQAGSAFSLIASMYCQKSTVACVTALDAIAPKTRSGYCTRMKAAVAPAYDPPYQRGQPQRSKRDAPDHWRLIELADAGDVGMADEVCAVGQVLLRRQMAQVVRAEVGDRKRAAVCAISGFARKF